MSRSPYAGTFPADHRIFRRPFLQGTIQQATPESRAHDEQMQELVKAVRAGQRHQRRVELLRAILARGNGDGAL